MPLSGNKQQIEFEAEKPEPNILRTTPICIKIITAAAIKKWQATKK